ncbi:hypothetical protein LQ318_10630 [Aliifodinibius salicampi]|uniref:C2H2-type domain-containing protein n=1 Tax=Fodinibius salicampi TaxID=1920655 RepID=A0ABT3PZR9_9BACT|nr:hypothetical protein [Fodinibius salicampi]MCW9713363.1 hypothetical protein [Fodinibius salicampi]
MDEEREQQNTEKEKELTCPECEKAFQDMRGLTSHARHMHELNKNEIMEMFNEKEDSTAWKIVGGIGAVILAIITAGKFR